MSEPKSQSLGFLTIEKATAETGIPESVFRRLVAEGRLRSVRISGVRRALLFRADLERLVAAALEMQ